MKKIMLLLVVAIFAWTFQPVNAQTTDTSNHVVVKKKVKTRRKGRNTSVKTVVKGSGNTDAVNGTTNVAITGKPMPPAEKSEPQVKTVYVPVASPAPAPVIIQAPSVEHHEPVTTSVTTTETKQVPVNTVTTTHVVHTTHSIAGAHIVHKKVYKKSVKAPAATVKTTTTTTTTKPQENN